MYTDGHATELDQVLGDLELTEPKDNRMRAARMAAHALVESGVMPSTNEEPYAEYVMRSGKRSSDILHQAAATLLAHGQIAVGSLRNACVKNQVMSD